MTTGHPPDALRRTVAAELWSAVQGGRSPPGVGIGIMSLAALLERRTPFDGADVLPLRFARPEPEPARIAR